MAADKHTIRIVDKDGNQSEVTLPGFALDATQEKLLRSIQALGKMNPKTAKAYEDLISATKEAVGATKDASGKQKQDAKALQSAVENAGQKQVSALKQFQTNFADRVGRDMRDTFTAGGNILTAAIKTATVGLAAGAGLLYKTFMDTSEAFRSLAQSGLGGAGASGIEAQDAVASLTLLGMTASEAASMLTSFGRASAVLGKANFAKFVSGIATSSTFAADLGLTLEEAAEYAAEEIDIRQRAFAGQMQLNEFNRLSVMESIEQTQRFASVMGRSMKDINASKKAFVDDNSNISSLMLRMGKDQSERLLAQINRYTGAAAAIGGDYERLMQGLLNAAAKQIPMQDANLQAIAATGPAGTRLVEIVNRMSKDLNSGDFSNVDKYVMEVTNATVAGGREFNSLLGVLAAGGNEVAGMLLNAANSGEQGRKKLAEALSNISRTVNDPMVTAAANFQNTMKQVTGAFETAKNQVLGSLAPPVNEFIKALTDTRLSYDREIDSKISAIRNNEKLSKEEKEQKIKELEEQRKVKQAEFKAKEKEITESKVLTDKQKQAALEKLYSEQRTGTVLEELRKALTTIAGTFIDVFLGGNGINSTAEDFGKTLSEKVVPWIRDTAEEIKKWLESLKGQTLGEKLESILKAAFSNIVIPAMVIAVKAGFKALFEHPEVIAGIIAMFAAGSLIRTAFATGAEMLFKAVLARLGIGAAATTATTAATGAGAGTAAAGGAAAAGAGLLAKAKSYGGMASNTLKALPTAGLAGKALTGASVVGSALMVGKDAFDVGSSLYKGESVKGADIGGVAGGVLGGVAGAFLGGPVGAALGASLGNMAGEWVGSFFDKDEAAQQGQDVAKQAAEQLQQQPGLAAMAMDPDHIRAVSTSLKDFNAVNLSNITAGLGSFNPALASLFDVIVKVKTQFVEVVNNKLGTFLNIIKGLNTQGAVLPLTTEYINKLASTIISIPVDPIVKLSTAFNALTTALKDFGDLTTDTMFGRMWDAFTGKQDQTEGVIKVLNNFADKVNSDKLLSAAQATQAYVTAMQGMANLVEPQRSTPTNANPTAVQDKAKTSAVSPQQMNPNEEMERLLRLVEMHTKRSAELLKTIGDNTDPAKNK